MPADYLSRLAESLAAGQQWPGAAPFANPASFRMPAAIQRIAAGYGPQVASEVMGRAMQSYMAPMLQGAVPPWGVAAGQPGLASTARGIMPQGAVPPWGAAAGQPGLASTARGMMPQGAVPPWEAAAGQPGFANNARAMMLQSEAAAGQPGLARNARAMMIPPGMSMPAQNEYLAPYRHPFQAALASALMGDMSRRA